jgi:phosphoglycerate dehydrogenase-like enzyme
MTRKFRVGITRDALNADGELIRGDIGLGLLDEADGVEWGFLPENTRVLSAEQVSGYDGLLVLGSRVTAETLNGVDRLAIIARFGAGFDTVDVEACNRNGVMLSTQPDALRRPVASAFITLILALAHKLMANDRITRAGRWQERHNYIGVGLKDRALGLVGMGNIGSEVFRLAKPFEMRHLAYDPYVDREEAAAAGVEVVGLETLLRTADFVCICCPLNEETYHLIDAERLMLMKPTSFLINVARGPIVDQEAISDALRKRRIQGAALDVFEQEPVDPDDPILALDNVIVSPHALAITDQGTLDCGRSAIRGILGVSEGRVPGNVVNRQVLDHPGLQEKLRLNRERSGAGS